MNSTSIRIINAYELCRSSIIAVVMIAVISHQGPAGANKRSYIVEPMNKKDLSQVPSGAAIWFHKNGNYWLYLPVGGRGYVKIDRKLYKFRRTQPGGATWGCMPMVFDSHGISVSIYKRAESWTIKLRFGTQSSEIHGLSCDSGD